MNEAQKAKVRAAVKEAIQKKVLIRAYIKGKVSKQTWEEKGIRFAKPI